MAGSLNTPDVLTQPIAENGDKNTIPSTNDQSLGQMSQSTGFPAICSERIADGGKAPRRADFNGAFNMLSRYIFFKQNGGVETFRADVSTAIGGYPKDAILGYKTSTEFKLVRSLIANNTYNFNTNPEYIDDDTHWETIRFSGTYHPDLFDWKWSDHELDNTPWLRADTFSWQSGSSYGNAYNHLLADIDGKTLQTETIGGITISYYLADDGHKICPESQASNVESIYSATGVAWYYIIDTTNQRFKLPRTQFGVTGLRDTVGNYVAAGLPNITGNLNISSTRRSADGCFSLVQTGGAEGWDGWGSNNMIKITMNAASSNSIYGASSTVQPKATQMYLYFYVGEFTQEAIENTAGLNTELFNGKADTDLNNVTASGKATAVGWGMPDYANAVSLTASDFPYTPTKPGLVIIIGAANTSFFVISVNDVVVWYLQGAPNYYGKSGWVIVDKNDVVTYQATSFDSAKFIPLKGA